jgi:hypothetical protein
VDAGIDGEERLKQRPSHDRTHMHNWLTERRFEFDRNFCHGKRTLLECGHLSLKPLNAGYRLN